MIEITATEKNGDEVKSVEYTELFDEKSSQLNRAAYLWTNKKKAPVEPGETAKFNIGTTAENLFVIRQQINKTNSYSFIRLTNEKKTFDTHVKEEDRGGISSGWAFVKNNRFFQYTDITNVPWSNKVLDIEYATFRDKTLPGSEEKWKLRISGNKKEKVAAELLAAMYDASLDQFVAHYWSIPGIWPNNSRIQISLVLIPLKDIYTNQQASMLKKIMISF
jgi:hypothetical protein